MARTEFQVAHIGYFEIVGRTWNETDLVPRSPDDRSSAFFMPIVPRRQAIRAKENFPSVRMRNLQGDNRTAGQNHFQSLFLQKTDAVPYGNFRVQGDRTVAANLLQQPLEKLRGDKWPGNFMQQDNRLRANLQETGQGFLAGRAAGDDVDGFRHKPPGPRQILGSYPNNDLRGKGRYQRHGPFEQGLAIQTEKCLGASANAITRASTQN